MPSDKHNSRTDRARDLISSLINVAWFWDVPLHQPWLLQCVLPLYPFDLPFFFSQPRKVTICSSHIMASVRDIKIAEALLVVCHCWNWDVTAFTYLDIGRAFHEYILHIYLDDWMDGRDAFHAVLCLYCCVCTKHNWIWSVLAYGLSNN